MNLKDSYYVLPYYVIHKLRDGESLNIGEADQLLMVVDEESIAKDICKKYKSETYRLEYERIDIWYEC